MKLKFCYLCGKPLDNDKSKDHIPPETIFKTEDRNFPLQIPAHSSCNGERSEEDQAIGQLVGILHGIPKSPKNKKLGFERVDLNDGRQTVALRIPLRHIIRRWVRGFHAALYREFLPDIDTAFIITSTPFPSGQFVNGMYRGMQIQKVIPLFTDLINKNRITGTIDSIICYNKTCQYDCVWVKADQGSWLCIYTMNIYNWTKLADSKNFPQQECIGAYYRPDRLAPSNASRATNLYFKQ